MSDKLILDGIEIEESHPRFETIGAIANNAENKIDHDRVSLKYTNESQSEVESVAIQPFIDENTPHRQMGVQIDPNCIGDLIDHLEAIEFDLKA